MGHLPIIPTRRDAVQISTLGTQFLAWFQGRRNASPRTIESYDLTYKQFVVYLSTHGLTDDLRHFTPENVDGFASWVASLRRKASTVNVKLAALHSLGQYGMKSKDSRGRYYLDENPLVRVVRPKRVKAPKKYLSLLELRQVMTFPKPPAVQVAMEIILDIQLRASELANANVEHVRLDGERVVLSVRVKGGAFHEETLGKDVSERLLEMLKFREPEPSEPLIVNERGGRYTRNTLTETIHRWACRAGVTRIPVRAHVLARHSVATLASEYKVEVPVIAALLRHADLKTVQEYIHRQSGVDQARELLRGILKGDLTQ